MTTIQRSKDWWLAKARLEGSSPVSAGRVGRPGPEMTTTVIDDGYLVPHSECDNCGMVDVPLTRGHCEGCICVRCKRTAEECGRSMNDTGWCEACEALLEPEPLVEEAEKALAVPTGGVCTICFVERELCATIVESEAEHVARGRAITWVASQPVPRDPDTTPDINYEKP